VATLRDVLESDAHSRWSRGKKALAVTQLGRPAVGFCGTAGLTVGGHVSHAMPASAPTRRPRPRWTDTTHDQRHAPLALERDIVTVQGRGRPARPEG
jgi:hypothetical protein